MNWDALAKNFLSPVLAADPSVVLPTGEIYILVSSILSTQTVSFKFVINKRDISNLSSYLTTSIYFITAFIRVSSIVFKGNRLLLNF